jgi:glycosyltransferase involved in cell wall biosynthesis
MPKVSVIIPVYGVEKYIERCVRSLFEQTLDDIEYLFVDDCTPDRSIDILKQVLEEYPQRKSQVLIHRMEKNSGQAAVRNWGMHNATGEYVTHCDSDDWVDVNMYKLLYEKGISDNCDIVICDYFVTNGNSKTIKKHHFSVNKLNMMFSSYNLWCKIIRRSVCANNDIMYPTGNMGEDMVYSVQLAWYSSSFGYVEKPLYYFCNNDSSITHTRDKNKSLSIFRQRKENEDIIELFINKKEIQGCKNNLVLSRLQTVSWLYPFVEDKEVLNIFRNTYTELFFDCLFARGISLKHKVRYYLAYLGLFPLLKNLHK